MPMYGSRECMAGRRYSININYGGMQIIHLSYHVDDDYTKLKTDSSWLLIPNIAAAREEMTWLSAAEADDDSPEFAGVIL